MSPLVQLAAEEAENPLIPPIPELVIGLIAFVIVFGFLAKKLLPNINKVLEQRREAIEGGIEKAEAAQTEAQSVLEQYKAQLAGKLVGESLEDHARQSRVIDRFLDELEEKAEAAR